MTKTDQKHLDNAFDFARKAKIALWNIEAERLNSLEFATYYGLLQRVVGLEKDLQAFTTNAPRKEI